VTTTNYHGRESVVTTTLRKWSDRGYSAVTMKEILASESFSILLPHAIVRSISPSRCNALDVAEEVEIVFLAEGIGIDRGDLLGDIEAALSKSPALIHNCLDFKSPKTCSVCALLWRIRSIGVVSVEQAR